MQHICHLFSVTKPVYRLRRFFRPLFSTTKRDQSSFLTSFFAFADYLPETALASPRRRIRPRGPAHMSQWSWRPAGGKVWTGWPYFLEGSRIRWSGLHVERGKRWKRRRNKLAVSSRRRPCCWPRQNLPDLGRARRRPKRWRGLV